MTYISQRNFESFGTIGNLSAALNSVVDYDNNGGFSTIGIHLTIPTGATIVFEGSHDGTNFFSVQVLDQATDSFISATTTNGDYLCPASALSTFRIRVSVAGSAAGSVIGRAQRDVANVNVTDTDNLTSINENTDRTILIDANNTTAVPLAAGGSFIGVATNILEFAQINITLFARPGVNAGDLTNAKASFFFEFSPDGTNWDISTVSLIRDPSLIVPIPTINSGKFFRVRYLNDGGVAAIAALSLLEPAGTPTLQTDFRITTYLLPFATKELTRTLEQVVTESDPVALTRSVTVGKNPDNIYINAPQTGSLTLTPAITPLGPGGIYTSDWFKCDGYIGTTIVIKTDQLSAVNGIEIDFGQDGATTIATTIRSFLAIDVAAGFTSFSSPIKGSYLRFKYVNGATLQGNFSISVILATIAVQISTEILPLTSWTTGQATVSSNTVPVNVIPAPTIGRKSFAVKLLSTSSEVVFIGPTSSVLPTTGYELSPGESVIVECDQTAGVYVIGKTSASQTLSYIEIL